MARPRARKKKPVPETPTCNCALLCDDVLLSQARGKHTLEGVINTVVVDSSRPVLGPCVTYVRVSNVYAPASVRVSLSRAADDVKVFEFEAKCPDVKDPLGMHTLIVPTPPCHLEEAGRYVLSVRADGIPIAESPILVVFVDPAKED